MGEVRTKSVLPVFLAEVAAPPDAGADPDPYDSDDHDDEEDDPLVVIIDPRKYQ